MVFETLKVLRDGGILSGHCGGAHESSGTRIGSPLCSETEVS
jgi:hypothetical protein